MSAPRTTIRTAAVTATTAVAAAALFALGGPAAADPPAVDFDPCTNALSHVAQWPGELGDGSTHYSDAFASYLLRQPACLKGA